jgi:prepilin-type N-terminal cleavage/methylation domain-containing protein
MKAFERQNGFTLIEALVVVAITVVLVGLVIGVAGRIDTQNKERLLGGIFAELNAALQEFADYEYRYKPINVINEGVEFYNSLDYPLDCNEVNVGQLENEIAIGLGTTNVRINPGWDNDPEDKDKDVYSGSAAMYFFLNQVPESRSVLNKINPEFLTNEDKYGNKMRIYIVIGSKQRAYPLICVLDPWGKPLRYDYYMNRKDFNKIYGNLPLSDYYIFATENKNVFPVLSSAGPDGEWNTSDDIKSR